MNQYSIVYNKQEFNPGSKWMLGVCLIHASLLKVKFDGIGVRNI